MEWTSHTTHKAKSGTKEAIVEQPSVLTGQCRYMVRERDGYIYTTIERGHIHGLENAKQRCAYLLAST